MKLSFLIYEPIADLGELDRRMGRVAGLGYQGIELSASHLRGLRDGHLTAEATPVRVGRTIQVWRIVLTDDDGRAICESRCSLAVLDGPGDVSNGVRQPAPTE